MKINYILLATAFTFTNLTFGQAKHELSIYAGGGLSTLSYTQAIGKQQNGLGGNVGVGYTYFFNETWGITTGAELGLYNAKATANRFTDRYETNDIVSDLFEFRTKVDNYSEKQHLMQVNIPFMLRYRDKENQQFYVAAGAKIGLPISQKYNEKSATINNSGYYEFEDVEYTSQEFVGFGAFTNRRDKGSFDTKIAVMASIEAGMRFPVNEKNAFYTGVYADYGLNNILKTNSTSRFIQYEAKSSELFQVNSLLNAQYNEGKLLKPITEKIVPLTIGIKVQFAFELQ